MSFHKVKFRNWEFEVDSELTRKVFENELNGSADTCDCNYCKNFFEQREEIFPEEIKNLFEELGIDFNKEKSVSETAQLENKLLNYTGHFHFAGKIISGETFNSESYSGIKLAKISEGFSICFGERKINSWVKVLFETNIPWVIESSE